jgi:hypothetical protein
MSVAFVVYTTVFATPASIENRTSQIGIQVNSFFNIVLAFISKLRDSLYVFLSPYQDDFQVFM